MRFRKYSDIDTKAYPLIVPNGNITVSREVSQEKNHLTPMKVYLLFEDRLSEQDQSDSKVTLEYGS